MKLYREKQVKKLFRDYTFLRNDTINGICKTLQPIELPSNEESSERLYPIKNTGSMFMPNLDEVNNIYKQEGFMEGAKWVIEQIKQQDK
jgi:hypothetical protein